MQRRIVFDLEWNYSRQRPAFDYHGLPLSLHGEIIQIGAVDADSGEEFSCLVRPRLIPRLNPLVAELTGCSSQQLASGREAAAALRAFRDWCGEDALLLSWSGQDARILKENLFLCGFGEDWPAAFDDVQRLFRRYSGGEKWEPPLTEAVEHFGIGGEIRWHDALSDARCAAEVYRRMGCPAAQSAEAAPQWKHCEELRHFPNRLSQDSWRLDPQLATLRCPLCGAALEAADHWQNGPKNLYWYSLLSCPDCGEQRLLFWQRRRENGLWHFVRGVVLPDKRQLRDWNWRYRRAKRKR